MSDVNSKDSKGKKQNKNIYTIKDDIMHQYQINIILTVVNLIQIHVAMLVKLSCEKNQINYLTVVKGESCSNFEIQQCIKKIQGSA